MTHLSLCKSLSQQHLKSWFGIALALMIIMAQAVPDTSLPSVVFETLHFCTSLLYSGNAFLSQISFLIYYCTDLQRILAAWLGWQYSVTWEHKYINSGLTAKSVHPHGQDCLKQRLYLVLADSKHFWTLKKLLLARSKAASGSMMNVTFTDAPQSWRTWVAILNLGVSNGVFLQLKMPSEPYKPYTEKLSDY